MPPGVVNAFRALSYQETSSVYVDPCVDRGTLKQPKMDPLRCPAGVIPAAHESPETSSYVHVKGFHGD